MVIIWFKLYPHFLGDRRKSAVGEDIDELADKWQAERQAADALAEAWRKLDAKGEEEMSEQWDDCIEAEAAYRKARDGK